jgi:hypothetical protein
LKYKYPKKKFQKGKFQIPESMSLSEYLRISAILNQRDLRGIYPANHADADPDEQGAHR